MKKRIVHQVGYLQELEREARSIKHKISVVLMSSFGKRSSSQQAALLSSFDGLGVACCL